jgi:TctA family transporter
MAAAITSPDFISAVLFWVPGHIGAGATAIDGHAMARKGEAGRAFADSVYVDAVKPGQD